MTHDPYFLSLYDLVMKRLNLPVKWMGWLGFTIENKREKILLKEYL
jgi:hypothetical protein